MILMVFNDDYKRVIDNEKGSMWLVLKALIIFTAVFFRINS
jgi:hypothetical protein